MRTAHQLPEQFVSRSRRPVRGHAGGPCFRYVRGPSGRRIAANDFLSSLR
ncbi:MAG: hypothetical protein DMG90_22120, partial [Acidobacteria bacterium]